jgi:hypothetical protein
MANFNTGKLDTGPHIAARGRALSPEQWIDRAIQLAWNDHTIGTPRYIMTGPDGSHLYRCASRSNPTTEHVLYINLEREEVTCDCKAAEWGSPCAHVGAAFYILHQAVRSTVARNMAGQRQYERWTRDLSPTALDAS